MTTTAIGNQAEQAASEYLQRSGYRIVGRNWKTNSCEIDIIAQKAHCMHFVEVKYRAHDWQGSGLEYITKPKLRQMRFAAEQWVAHFTWVGAINLAAIEVCEPDFAVGTFIESISID